MPFPTELAGTARAQELDDWFGRWPQFHDTEVRARQTLEPGAARGELAYELPTEVSKCR